MLAEIIEEAYDVDGRPIMEPVTRRKRKVFHPTYPMKFFLAHPVTVHCSSMEEIKRFLRKCRYVSDRKQFDKDDYWVPPQEFEKTRAGDCEDFALWTWRQLLELEIPCRFVVGRSGRYGEGHAWLTLQQDGRCYLMECQAASQRYLPRLSMLRYEPELSVAFDGKDVKYFRHEPKAYNPRFREVFPLACKWLVFWSWFWIKFLVRLPLLPYHIVRRIIRRRKAQQLPGGDSSSRADAGIVTPQE